MIERILRELGFAEKEVRVYLAVLEQGKATPASIARITSINRSTVYSVAKELLEKGVIVEDIGGPKGYLVALPPEDLKNLVRKEERDLDSKKLLIEQAIGELSTLTKNTKYSIPKISFVYEEDVEDFLYKQSPEWSKSIMEHDGVWWGFQDPTFVKNYPKWIDWYWKECAPKKLTLKLLSSESESEKEMTKLGYDRRIIRFWKQSEEFTATTWVTGDYLILIMTGQKPSYLVQIHDAMLAHNMREMFKGIWNGRE